MAFRLYSNDLQDGAKMPAQQVFNGMGYHGGNLSPHLAWDGVPEGSKSFVITLYDPDAPTGSGWWHWVVANIPQDTRELPQGAGSSKASLPAGAIQTRTDFGSTGYGGAAPPQGESHRYQFIIHALDVDSIEVDERRRVRSRRPLTPSTTSLSHQHYYPSNVMLSLFVIISCATAAFVFRFYR